MKIDNLADALIEIARLQKRIESDGQIIAKQDDRIEQLEGPCWHCMNPDSGPAERHFHEPEGWHWHHYIDPGDGLPSPCKNSELFERTLARAWSQAAGL